MWHSTQCCHPFTQKLYHTYAYIFTRFKYENLVYFVHISVFTQFCRISLDFFSASASEGGNPSSKLLQQTSNGRCRWQAATLGPRCWCFSHGFEWMTHKVGFSTFSPFLWFFFFRFFVLRCLFLGFALVTFLWMLQIFARISFLFLFWPSRVGSGLFMRNATHSFLPFRLCLLLFRSGPGSVPD